MRCCGTDINGYGDVPRWQKPGQRVQPCWRLQGSVSQCWLRHPEMYRPAGESDARLLHPPCQLSNPATESLTSRSEKIAGDSCRDESSALSTNRSPRAGATRRIAEGVPLKLLAESSGQRSCELRYQLVAGLATVAGRCNRCARGNQYKSSSTTAIFATKFNARKKYSPYGESTIEAAKKP